ncbi:MAG TPA: hypothetical protein VJ625_02170, partial [Propionibacteriaceae bacterium]|nr:hypothetical protein [Propionibacteriaceae bacterium]
DPSQIVVVNVPGLGNLEGVAGTLRISGIVCLVAGGVLLVGGILTLALGRKRPAAVTAGSTYPPGPPGPPPRGYSMQQQYPPQQPPMQQYPPQQYPPQQYPPQPPPQG